MQNGFPEDQGAALVSHHYSGSWKAEADAAREHREEVEKKKEEERKKEDEKKEAEEKKKQELQRIKTSLST